MKAVIFAVACVVVEGSTACTEAGKSRYISFETLANKHFCAESCLRESDFEALLPFESNLILAKQEAGCQARGYGTLVSSELHAKGPFFRSVDFYSQEDAAAHEPCCGTCSPGSEKHWAISETGCIERCMSTGEAARLAVFEAGFQRSQSISPCRDEGFQTLVSTEIDAVGPYFAMSDKFVSAMPDTAVFI
jgi:hypothetical protein